MSQTRITKYILSERKMDRGVLRYCTENLLLLIGYITPKPVPDPRGNHLPRKTREKAIGLKDSDDDT